MGNEGFGRLVRGISAATLVFVGSATAGHADQIAANTLSLSKIKIAMPFTVLVQRAALEASLKSGAFKKEGLEVELNRFRSWNEPIQAIAGDAAHFAFGGASFMRAVVGHKAPVRALALVSSRMPYALYVKKDSGIKSLKDVKGKIIQTVRVGATLDNVWKQMLRTVGLKMSDVKRVQSFNGFGSLASGNVDIANISSTYIGKARKAGFVMVIDYNDWRKQQGLSTTAGNNLGWGTSLKMLKDHPDTVRAFLRAIAKSTARLRNDRGFAISVLKGKPYSMSEATASEVYDLHRSRWMLRLDPSKGDYAFDAEMTEIVMKRPKGSISVAAVSDTGPINDVLRELKLSF